MSLQTQDFSSQLADLDRIQTACKKLMETKHYQAMGESGIHAIMAKSRSLGIHPFEALNGGFTCINGKVGMSTEMMAALVRQRGHSITKDPKSNAEIVILHGKRADNGDTWTCSFSKEDAIAAGLWNTATWKKYPAVMLYNRCMSQLFRQLFPDLSVGAGYVEDELKEITKTGEYAYTKNTYLEPKDWKTIDMKVEEIKTEPEKNSVRQPEKLSAKQVEEIKMILEECDEKFKEWFNKVVKNNHKVNDISDLPSSLFEEMKTVCTKNMLETHAKQNQVFQENSLKEKVQ